MADQDASDLALAEISLARAEASLNLELTAADVIDVKAVGLATADIAALTILVAAHNAIQRWWLPAIPMAVSAVLFFVVLRQRVWKFAPDLTEFRENNYGLSRTEITEAMYVDVLRCKEINEPLLQFKATAFLWGYRILASGLLALCAVAVWQLFD